MRMRIAALLGMLLLTCASPSQDRGESDEALTKALKEADTVFTGKIGKVRPRGQTRSIPPSTFGTITFKDAKALRGNVADAPEYAYSYKEGTTMNIDLGAKGSVLVAVKSKGVLVMIPATEASLALARKVLEAREK